MQIPPNDMAGVAGRGCLRGAGVSRLGRHKELGFCPKGLGGQMEIRPGHSAQAAPALQRGVEEKEAGPKAPVTWRVDRTPRGEGDRDPETGRDLEMGREAETEGGRLT